MGTRRVSSTVRPESRESSKILETDVIVSYKLLFSDRYLKFTNVPQADVPSNTVHNGNIVIAPIPAAAISTAIARIEISKCVHIRRIVTRLAEQIADAIHGACEHTSSAVEV